MLPPANSFRKTNLGCNPFVMRILQSQFSRKYLNRKEFTPRGGGGGTLPLELMKHEEGPSY
jgi:hypothetical protein